MDFPHQKRESQEYGCSPGNGITPMPLSAAPLATEGEATPGPDDYNPYEDVGRGATAEEAPTERADPYSFDDIGAGLAADLEAASLNFGDGPQF
jgi:hypothetical protein